MGSPAADGRADACAAASGVRSGMGVPAAVLAAALPVPWGEADTLAADAPIPEKLGRCGI